MKITDILIRTTLLYTKVYTKMIDGSNKAGEGLKNYLGDEENIKHISLIVYDLMPLSVKLGLRYEKFYERFKVVFVGIRNQLFTYEKEKESKALSPQVTKKPRISKAKVIAKKSTTGVSKVASDLSEKAPKIKKSNALKSKSVKTV